MPKQKRRISSQNYDGDTILGNQEHLPGQLDRDTGYPEQQVYEDFEDYDALYGPDAYLGDQYPVTPAGQLMTEVAQSAASVSEPELSGEIRQEKAQERAEIRSESLTAQETDEAWAGRPQARE